MGLYNPINIVCSGEVFELIPLLCVVFGVFFNELFDLFYYFDLFIQFIRSFCRGYFDYFFSWCVQFDDELSDWDI